MLVYTYDIEHRALPVESYRVFNTEGEVEDFAFGVAIDNEFNLNKVNWRVKQARNACGGYGEISLPQTEFGRSIITVLHELAHVAAPEGSHHGTRWFNWFTYLLGQEVGIMAKTAIEYEIRKEVA